MTLTESLLFVLASPLILEGFAIVAVALVLVVQRR